jgi:preprotein translocase, secE subunit
MFKFISDAFREISHVVWPTPKETRTYMNYIAMTIIVMTIFLAIAGYAFRTGLQFTKHVVNPAGQLQTEIIQEEQKENADAALNEEYKKFGIENNTSSGVTVETEPVTTENSQSHEETTATGTIQLPSEIEETQSGSVQ